MNVRISADHAEVQEKLDNEKLALIAKFQAELDVAFYDKISTPEQVLDVYEKLKMFKALSGEDYKITIKENTIV